MNTVLNYINNMDDLVAFNVFQVENSPLIRKRIARARYVATAVCGLTPLLLALLADSFFLVALSPVLAIYAHIALARRIRVRLPKEIKKRLEESGAERFLNIPRSLALEEDGLLSSSEAGLAKHPYSSVAEIVKSDRHTFIVIKGGTGYAIPLSQVDDRYDDLFVELRRRVQAAGPRGLA